jgi:hypothetical protein
MILEVILTLFRTNYGPIRRSNGGIYMITDLYESETEAYGPIRKSNRGINIIADLYKGQTEAYI